MNLYNEIELKYFSLILCTVRCDEIGNESVKVGADEKLYFILGVCINQQTIKHLVKDGINLFYVLCRHLCYDIYYQVKDNFSIKLNGHGMPIIIH